jgi:hypothetical protein
MSEAMTISHQTVRLGKGCHLSGDTDEVCVIELASILAGEPLTDHPASVSPVLAAFMRGYNDGIDERRRQTLKPYAAWCVGTAPARRADERARRRLIAAYPTGGMLRLSAWLWVREGATIDEAGSELIGRRVGLRVARHDDDAEHERVLALIDALIGRHADDTPPTREAGSGIRGACDVGA